ncbi:redoxin domain-containing protein [Balneola sp. MJW-20]|uniref:redoxin domain-containing protein n=1 Tax=Gracilimonas aurantiaca TaxID=3234185 RepID=UPI003465E242
MKIKEGMKAPQFILQNTEGEKVSLNQVNQDKNIVLLFFPLAFSSTCIKELCDTRDNMKFYEALDAEVIGISIDSFFTLKEFKESQNLNFTLLSDFNKEVSKDYGCLYDDFYGMVGVSKRSAFVIDREGVIQYSEVLDDASKLPDFAAIQDILEELNN